MKVAIIMYDKMSLLSFSQIYEFFKRTDIASLSVDCCALKYEIIDEFGLKILPDIHSESLDGYDIVAVPSGIGAMSLRYDDIFLSWIRSARKANLKISCDMGAFIFGAARMLENKQVCIRAGYMNALKEYCNPSDGNDCFCKDVFSFSEFNDDVMFKLENCLSELI
ncbi:hypothetical protein [Campylobacter sputorum]|uniref:hypothetical protein n=1 Tax=Campylobacter sputorum TaxID=206 RepID=UPI000B788DA3|nr:hypothetical protein [Campylobacter sputorum]ASM36575.1 DUF4066 domain protein [Campylobacter sputorum bv. faecalis CCUG 20703]